MVDFYWGEMAERLYQYVIACDPQRFLWNIKEQTAPVGPHCP